MLQWLMRSINRGAKSGDVANEGLQLAVQGQDEMPSQPMKRLQIEINLLPPEYAPKSPYSPRNISFIVLSFLLLSFLVVDALQVIHREKEFNQRAQDMLRMAGRFSQLNKSIKALRERTALLNKRYNDLVEVLNQRVTWSDKLSQIHAQIPADVWLLEVSLERKMPQIPLVKMTQDKSNKSTQSKTNKPTSTPPPQKPQEQIILHILGEATDLTRIAEFIDRLETIPFIASMQFSSSDQRAIGEHLVMSFEIIAQVTTEEETPLNKFQD